MRGIAPGRSALWRVNYRLDVTETFRELHERRAEVDPAPGALQHPLDQVAHVVGREDRGRELRDAGPGHEHLARLVDPDLLDGRVVEVLLERSQPCDCVEQLLDCPRYVDQR